jgi:hypothetical protein
VGPFAEPETGFSGQIPQLEEYEPHKKLGFAPVRMPKRHNTAAFSAQGFFVGPENVFASPHYYFRYTQYKEKVDPAENSAHKEYKFRDFRLRNPDMRFGGRHRLDIGLVHGLS